MATITDMLTTSDIFNGLDEYKLPMARAMARKADADITALFGALNGGTSLGATGDLLDVSTFMMLLYTVEAANAVGPMVGIFHPWHIARLRNLFLSQSNVAWTGIATAGQAPGGSTQDSVQGVAPAGNILGVNLYSSKSVDTPTTGANGRSDAVGAVLCTGPDGALGRCTKWDLRVELQRDASMRGTEIVVTRCYGTGELRDTAGISYLGLYDYGDFD